MVCLSLENCNSFLVHEFALSLDDEGLAGNGWRNLSSWHDPAAEFLVPYAGSYGQDLSLVGCQSHFVECTRPVQGQVHREVANRHFTRLFVLQVWKEMKCSVSMLFIYIL